MAKPTSGQMKEFWTLVNGGKITSGNFQPFLMNPNGYTSGNLTEYHVTVDYRKNLKEMIKDGQYDWSNNDITAKNFPTKGEGIAEVNLEFVHLDKVASTDEVEAYLEANGLRAATLEELLAFGAKYPEIQRKFPVIALGSSWVDRDGDSNVPSLDMYGSVRSLNLFWADIDWDEDCHFLTIHK